LKILKTRPVVTLFYSHSYFLGYIIHYLLWHDSVCDEEVEGIDFVADYLPVCVYVLARSNSLAL